MPAAWIPLLVVLATASLDTSLQTTFVQGTPAEVEHAVQSAPAILEQVDRNGRTPLALASAFNPDPRVVALLIRLGAPLEAVDRHGWTPLILAARYNSAPAVWELLRAGANPRVRDLKHHTAADAAAQNPLIAGTSLYWHLYRAQYGDNR